MQLIDFYRRHERQFQRLPTDKSLPLMSIKQSGTSRILTLPKSLWTSRHPFSLGVLCEEVYANTRETQEPLPSSDHWQPKHLGGGMSGKVEGIENCSRSFLLLGRNFLNRKPIQLAQKVFENRGDMHIICCEELFERGSHYWKESIREQSRVGI